MEHGLSTRAGKVVETYTVMGRKKRLGNLMKLKDVQF